MYRWQEQGVAFWGENQEKAGGQLASGRVLLRPHDVVDVNEETAVHEIRGGIDDDQRIFAGGAAEAMGYSRTLWQHGDVGVDGGDRRTRKKRNRSCASSRPQLKEHGRAPGQQSGRESFQHIRRSDDGTTPDPFVFPC